MKQHLTWGCIHGICKNVNVTRCTLRRRVSSRLEVSMPKTLTPPRNKTKRRRQGGCVHDIDLEMAMTFEAWALANGYDPAKRVYVK